jgi:amino acid permease
MYPASSLFIAIGQLAIVVLVLVSYPLQVHPCRNCLDKVFGGAVQHKAVPTSEAEAEEVELLEDEHHGSNEMTRFKHTALTAAIIGSGFVIAYFVDDLRTVLAFVGSTGSTTISFILPGLFYWKVGQGGLECHRLLTDTFLQLSRGDPSKKMLNRAALVLTTYGVCVFVFWHVVVIAPVRSSADDLLFLA